VIIPKSGMHKERLSIDMTHSPGPGKYNENSLFLQTRSPSIKFNQSPKWAIMSGKEGPGPSHYNVKDTAIQPFTKSISFNKT
jgi:hypothetical protein